MNNIFKLSLLAGLITPMVAVAGPSAIVDNGNNDGAGSLRAALASGANNIIIKGKVDTITITETLQYTGDQPLRLSGNGQTVDATALDADILVITQGVDTSISGLTFAGPGNYNFDNQGGGKGIFIDVPETRTGTVNVSLDNVTVTGTGNHGVHISDCTIGDDCGGGGGGAGDGSPASINVRVNAVIIDSVGFGKADADGIRVDERNEGDINFSATNSRFVNVGADGVELDEGNNGSVILNVSNSSFADNGAFCLGDTDLQVGDACFDDGDPDVDDGFDVDEAGPGSIIGKLNNLSVTNNFDEGLDFDEEDQGGFDIKLVNITATGNEDEGIKLSEENDGSIIAELTAITLTNNNGSKEDTEIEEEDAGDVSVSISGSFIDEVKVEEDGSGVGTIKVRGSTIVETLDLDNVDEI